MTNIILTLIKEIAGRRKLLYITLLLILIVNIMLPKFYSVLELLTRIRFVLILIGHSLLSLIILLLYSFNYLLKSKLKFKLKFGAYWDKEINPYCPNCKTPLHTTKVESFGIVTLLCSKCNKLLLFSNENGKLLSMNIVVDEVKKLFKIT